MVLDIPARLLPVYAFEGAVFVVGVVIWWIFQLSASTARWRQSRLERWDVDLHGFLIMCLQVIFGSIMGAIAMRGISAFLPKSIQSDSLFTVMLTNLGLHAGAVVGAIIPSRQPPRFHAEQWADEAPATAIPLSTPRAVIAGVVTFFAAIALIAVISLIWQALLSALHIPAEKQELLDIFGKTREPMKLAVMSFVAIVVAPLAEELAFRAGLFRFLRGRVQPWIAYAGPAFLFSLLHWNVAVFLPLLALGMLFSLAYQRTGRILVSVVAHGLFNLNTIVLVLLNVNI